MGIIEGLAVETYCRLGLDPAVPVDTFRLARLLFGRDAIEYGVGIAGERAKTYVLGRERRIAIRRRLPVDEAQHAIGHEIGHAVFDELGYAGENIECACDLFGAALMAPLPAMQSMMREFGFDHEAVADEIAASQTWAALRIAEVTGIPRAVLTPAKIYVRGPESFVWGSERALRQLAREPRSPRVGLARLTDDPRRVVIDIDPFGDGS